MICPQHEQLQAYHDGELAPALREAFERHLVSCDPCSSELLRLRALSRLFAGGARPRLSKIAAWRVRRGVDQAMQRGVLRLARILGAAAACVVLGGSLRLMQQMKKAPEMAPPWVDVASAIDADSSSRDAGTPAARWYLADASHGSSFDNVQP